MLKYTLCFIRQGQQILMLKRKYSPNKGLWNGVGGKIEQDETPDESIIREVYEETGIELKFAEHCGEVTWISDSGNSGMYVYIANFPEGFVLETPQQTDEGILDWKAVDWVLDQNNTEVVDNIPIFLPKMIERSTRCNFCFTYSNGELIDYKESKNI